MRTFLTLLLLVLSASSLGAQSPGVAGAALELRVQAKPASSTIAGEIEPANVSERSRPAVQEDDPILGAGFWRNVLAGVIVTVVSALILRAIL
jgi:hypothetical protein